MSRFQPIDFYQRLPPKPYQLLPFRFTALNDRGEYVVTNLAGEHTILPGGQLRALVRHELPHTSTDYQNLRAQHFLCDDSSRSSPDLLALKVRSRYRRLAEFTGLHIFVVTLRCEHSCPYCQVSRQTEDTEAFDMSRETADKALDFVFRSPSPAIKIEFQGGESLLNFELIRYIVDRAETINETAKRNLQFVIATNLAIVTDDMLAFCRNHRIHLSTSLDGPEDLHNKNRPRPGRNSHQRALEGIERARRIVGRDAVSALMTTTAGSLDRVREIIDSYVGLGFTGMFLRPLSPYGFAVKTNAIAAYNADRWVKFYKDGFADRHFTEAYAGVQHHDLMVGIPLYSDDPSRHNYVVQAEGAFDETIAGILNLKRMGQRVEIRVVVHAQTIDRLPKLAEFIARNLLFVDHVALMGLEITGFTRGNLKKLWIDPYDYRQALEEAVEILAAYRVPVKVYNHQLCVVTRRVREFCVRSISDWKNEYLPQCAGCDFRTQCGGFFSSQVKYRHSDHIKPLSA